jgi:hypothetical protein
LTNKGLGLRMSTGTQEPTKKSEKRVAKPSPTVVKHTFASLRKHMQEIKGGLDSSTVLEVVEEDESSGTKENKNPERKENKILTPPFVVDLLTQVESPTRMMQARQPFSLERVGGLPDQTRGLVCSRHVPRREEWISSSTSERWVKWPARYLGT